MTGLLDHLATGATTVCRAWRVTRRDGVVSGFTDHDADLAFDGVTFCAGAGLTARTLSQTTGLAVDNTEAMGALTGDVLTAEDLAAGRWDGAEVMCWLVNWAEPAERMVQFRGTVGEVTRTGAAFRAELRGLTEVLNRPMGRVFERDCGAALGDARCKVDLDDAAFRAEAVIAKVDEGGRVLVLRLDGFDGGWFDRGSLRILDGAAGGLAGTVRRDRRMADLRHVELVLPPEIAPVAGDRVALVAGCDKRGETCREKFRNFRNFRGFPDLPGEDWLAAYPLRSARNTGGSRRGA